MPSYSNYSVCNLFRILKYNLIELLYRVYIYLRIGHLLYYILIIAQPRYAHKSCLLCWFSWASCRVQMMLGHYSPVQSYVKYVYITIDTWVCTLSIILASSPPCPAGFPPSNLIHVKYLSYSSFLQLVNYPSRPPPQFGHWVSFTIQICSIPLLISLLSQNA